MNRADLIGCAIGLVLLGLWVVVYVVVVYP